MAVERTPSGSSLIDVLDRVLDKGIVIDAWVRVSLVGIDLVTVEARVVVASIDKAEQIGLNWWRNDPRLTMAGQNTMVDTTDVEARLARIEEALTRLAPPANPAAKPARKS